MIASRSQKLIPILAPYHRIRAIHLIAGYGQSSHRIAQKAVAPITLADASSSQRICCVVEETSRVSSCRRWVHVSMHKAEDKNNENSSTTTNHQETDTSAPAFVSAPASAILSSSASISSSSSSEQHNQEQPQQQLIVTPTCWKRIQQLAAKRNLSLDSVYLRVYVDAGGCSGFSYKFEMDDHPLILNNDTEESNSSSNSSSEDADIVFANSDNPDLRVVVDTTSLELIRGSTIDYVEEMIKSSFEVRDNPQSVSACGCGSSFAIKNFASNPALD